MRLLAATKLICLSACAMCLGACAMRGEPAFTDLSSNPNSIETSEAPETNAPKESESCAKLSELKIGMTASQALLSCERKPLRTSDAILRGGIKETTWAYEGSYLHFVDGKLKSIQDLR